MGAFLLSMLAAVLICLIAIRPLLPRARNSDVPKRARILAIAAGIGYGVLGRFVFGFAYAKWSPDVPMWLSSSFAVMSVSFLFFIPLVIGFLDQVASDPVPRASPWLRAFFAPMVPVLLMLGLMSMLSIEGIICIAMASPIFLFIAGIGGFIGLAVRRQTERKSRTGMISFMICLPYLASPIEHYLTVPVEMRQVQNTVHIRAAPETVWNEIKSVRAIARSELPFRVAHLIGLPRPIEATLSRDGVGGIRIATFERGLKFRETVTRWEPGHRLAFAIAAEPSPASALDEHVAVGGPYFDVIDGSYELEAGADGSTRLTLTSHQRLSTRFNFYARLWSDFIMSDLQSAIMEVVRARSERADGH